MNAVEAESQALLPQRASAPASTWVRKTIVGACVLSGCAVVAVVVTGGFPGTSLANTRSPLGDAKPLPLSPRQRARLQARIARARMGQTMVDAETIQAPTFDELKPLQQFNTVGDGGVDGSNFHHQNIFHNYPGHEGCQTACEGDHVTFETCQAKYYCEWDVGKCWSAVGPDPCPESKQAMYDMWEDHYNDYETGLHHWLDGFPASFDNYAYPGTIGCESTCEGINMDEKTCGSMFFCEWDEGKCWSAVGPNECPQTVHEMHELWYEYVHKHLQPDGIAATPTPSPLPWFTPIPTPAGTPEPTPTLFDAGGHPTAAPTTTYDAKGHVVATPAPTYYDAQGHVVVSEPTPLPVLYDAQGHPTAEPTAHIDASGHVMVTHPTYYDAQGHVVPTPTPQYFDVSGNPVAAPTTAYDAKGKVLATPTPVYYDEKGKPVPTPKPLFFDVRGHPVSTPAAVTTATAMPTVMYDAAGHPTATPAPTYYDAQGHVVVSEPTPLPVLYDAQGHPTAEPTAHIDASGHVMVTPTPTYYDAQGHVVPTPTPQYFDVSGNPVAAPTTAYDAKGKVLATPTPVYYDEKGKPVPTPKPLFFDVRGHPVSTPAAVTTATAMPTVMYDAAGHPTATPTPPSVEPVAHDSAGPVPTPTPTAVTKKKEKESLPGHHHEHFDHEYPGTEGCEAICEGHGFGEEECNAMFFCEFADGRCYSALGPNPCPNTEAELKDAWKDFDTDYETTSNATLEKLLPDAPDKNIYNPLYKHPSFEGNWVGYPGTKGCEATCEGVDVDEQACASMFYCVWDGGRCYSGVGPNPCPLTEQEMRDALAHER